ncbi:MAG: response regulator [Candidatus Abyssobacteria bacterium SURF_5]|uniref:Response regulator n=1 Tax=Abyssobacteria bacterium (strain SURF_5) TaxID=2093360 RepID=A0A3A4NLY7_ABYX5|nr:MAG: response regulator [Candidatus Abyssubacteria bacterium SURF_5]
MRRWRPERSIIMQKTQETHEIHVLLVDDEENFRANAKSLFRKRGFNIQTAASGSEAIAAVKKESFDVILLDLKMPGMDGNEVLYSLKKIRPDIQVIILTGYGSSESVTFGLRHGAFAYLVKPCDIDLIAVKIREAYHKKKGTYEKERRVRDIMVSLSSFGSVRDDWTIAEAIAILLGQKTIVTDSVEEEPIEVVIGSKTVITTTVDEGVHRCVLVRDRADKIIGIISFTDFLQGLESTYLRLLSERPSLIVSESGRTHGQIFSNMVHELGKKKVRELMLDKPPSIDADADLLEATNRLLSLNVRRLLVMDEDKVIGVIREKDLMFEMANIIG